MTTQNATKNFDYTTIADQTGVVKPVYGILTFQQTTCWFYLHVKRVFCRTYQGVPRPATVYLFPIPESNGSADHQVPLRYSIRPGRSLFGISLCST